MIRLLADQANAGLKAARFPLPLNAVVNRRLLTALQTEHDHLYQLMTTGERLDYRIVGV